MNAGITNYNYMSDDCIFCKIIKGEIPNHTVYEDEHVLAFLDIFPHAKGHTVIIPKEHYESLEDLSEEQWKNISIALKETLQKVNEKLNPDGTNIGINNKEIAGQVVPHVHWHIIPRYKNDGGGSIHSIIKNPGDTSVEKLAELFN
jgi:histidine triad (HIT) family protein